jgi:hypothetical protein
MKAVAQGCAIALIAGLATLAAPARAGLVYFGSGESSCRPTEAGNPGFRYSGFRLTNIANSDQYVTCSMELNREVTRYNLVPGAGFDMQLIVATSDPTVKQVTCLAEVLNSGSKLQVTRTLSLSATQAAHFHFGKTELVADNDLAMLSATCRLPSKAIVGRLFVKQPEVDVVL